MYRECRFRRNCINGLYCTKINEYVEYSLKKECETKTTNL
nr:MAG TPA: hypothetical protein [Caudoviricetes sp.]